MCIQNIQSFINIFYPIGTAVIVFITYAVSKDTTYYLYVGYFFSTLWLLMLYETKKKKNDIIYGKSRKLAIALFFSLFTIFLLVLLPLAIVEGDTSLFNGDNSTLNERLILTVLIGGGVAYSVYWVINKLGKRRLHFSGFISQVLFISLGIVFFFTINGLALILEKISHST